MKRRGERNYGALPPRQPAEQRQRRIFDSGLGVRVVQVPSELEGIQAGVETPEWAALGKVQMGSPREGGGGRRWWKKGGG